MAQKVNFDTLTKDQLNQYTDKAMKMRNAGILLTITGIGCIAAEILIFNYAFGNDASPGFGGLLPMVYGIPAAMIGIPLWTVGGGRMKLITLDVSELNLYYDKYVKLRNAGMIATLGGIGLLAAGLIINSSVSFYPVLVGTVSTIIGIPLWAAGGGMKSAAEITLQKYNLIPENSLALGVGITLRF
jgi:predicted house-cleaning NTP pyrophosphatase (Maf/HAM1 superfamily)